MMSNHNNGWQRQVEYDPSRSTVNEAEMMEKRIRHMGAKPGKLKDSVKKLSDSSEFRDVLYNIAMRIANYYH